MQGTTYLLGQRKLVLSYSGDKLLVRTGGGWGELTELLERFTLEDQRKVFPSDMSNQKEPTNARPVHGENSAFAWKHILRGGSKNDTKAARMKKALRPTWQLGSVDQQAFD